ncbi:MULTISPECIES: amidohydrolase family protein [Phyllobacteriaceae]|jgi:cytosine/creatinine deaminase|uniref:Cytosine deaminase n=1 Tax=Mesorhizobium hungaricum TaxID=1566387 RepID=A0A1C2DJL4_9HYPH|nr:MULTISPECIES: amidohydrolase family protein [Mesorhizobium]MBN9233246.1 amidohydrolase family protein [Mesorhizobium sp.]MDQ0332065.1 cytosine/adenosine deaminase-related metal-dependent hydrolase [Mesorhizobium sp. YL-MeA3-2017]OCX14845.1 cytosine deaminase [Mesorhizobium hungaricum]
MSRDFLLSNVRPNGGPSTMVLVKDGRFAPVDAAPNINSLDVVDGGNALMLPGLVEAHTHLDKTLYGMGWYRNEVGPRLIDKIDNERAMKKELGIDPARQSARQAVLSVGHGTTHIRSHVDVDTDIGLAGIEGVMATREKYRDIVDIEIVAFPQSGVLVRPGTVELMEEALRMGAEVVGGLDPSGIDRDPKGHLDIVFGLAERFARPIDIHLHEAGELGAFALELTVERTKALGMQGKVTLSHAFCLGMQDHLAVGALIDGLREAGIHIMTTGPSSRPAPPVKRLLEAGVVVCSGNDGIRDTWGPYGNGDMLERATFVGQRNNFRRDDELQLALDVCTHGGASVMALQDYGLKPGCSADFVLVDAETVAEAVAAHPPRKLVVKKGRVTARDGRALVAMP